MGYIEASDETPEEVFALIQARKQQKATAALAMWDALPPEEKQRRIAALEQSIQAVADLKRKLRGII